jgi:hypothetical protein
MKPLIVGHRALYDGQGRARLVPVHVEDLGRAGARVGGSYATDCRALLVGEFSFFLSYYEKNEPALLRGFSANLVKSAALLAYSDRKTAYLRLAECLQRRASDLDAGLHDAPAFTVAPPPPPLSSRPQEGYQRTRSPSPPVFQVAKQAPASPVLLAQPATSATPPQVAAMRVMPPRPTIK